MILSAQIIYLIIYLCAAVSATYSDESVLLSDASTPFHFSNSTSSFSSLLLLINPLFYTITASSDTNLSVDNCRLTISSSQTVPFHFEGRSYLHQLSLNFANTFSSQIPSLLAAGSSSSLETQTWFTESILTDIEVSSSQATLLLSASANTQTVSGCSFSNITMASSTSSAPLALPALVDTSYVRGSSFHGCDDVFYGTIVPGITPNTRSLFSCSNSSFVRCIRRASSSYNTPCSQYLTQDCTSSGSSSQLMISFQTEFARCVFTACYSSSNGGVIYSPASPLTLTACSFTDCYANSRNGGVVYISGGTLTIKDSTSFTNCYCQGSGNGGAIWASGTTLSIADSAFDRVHAAGQGGAGYLNSVTEISNCNFTGCYTNANNGHGGALRVDGNSLTLSDSRFSSCSVSSTGYGGAIYAECLSIKLPIQSCIFDQCSVPEDGGAIKLCNITFTGPCVFDGCTFSSCRSGAAGGGAVFWAVNSALYTGYIWFKSCVFTGNTAADSYSGRTAGTDVYFYYNNTAVRTYPFDENCYTTTSGVYVVYPLRPEDDIFSPTHDWLTLRSAFYVSHVPQTPLDNTCQKESTTACATFDAAFTAASADSSTRMINLHVDANPGNNNFTTAAASYALSDTGLTVKSTVQDSTQCILSIHDRGNPATHVFTVSTGVIDFSYFTIEFAANSLTNEAVFVRQTGNGNVKLTHIQINSTAGFSLPHYLMSIDDGVCICSNVHFCDLTLASQPLFQTLQHISFESTSLSDVTRTSGSGAILEMHVADAANVAISSLSFSHCRCQSDDGVSGGLYLSFTAAPLSLTLSNIEFPQTCTFGKTFETERNIYIACIGCDATAIMRSASLVSIISDPYDSDEASLYWVADSPSSRQLLSASLLHFIYSPSSDPAELTVTVAGVNSNGEQGWFEEDYCGWSDLPCQLISTALNHGGSKTTQVLFKAGRHSSETSQIVVDKAFTFLGGEGVEKEVTKIGSASGIHLIQAASATVSFNSIQYILMSGNQLISCPLFKTTEGTLSLTSVTVSSEQTLTSLTSDLINVAGVNNANVGLSLTDCAFGTSTSCFGISPGSSLITVQLGSLSSFQATTTGDNTIPFYVCRSSTGGSAASVLSLTLTSSPSSFTMSSLSFNTPPSQTPVDRDVLVTCSDGTQMITPEWWNGIVNEYNEENENRYWVKETTRSGRVSDGTSLLHFLYSPSVADSNDAYVSQSGVDVDSCGWIDLPCLSIPNALVALSNAVATKTIHIYRTISTTALQVEEDESIALIGEDAGVLSLENLPTAGSDSVLGCTTTSSTLTINTVDISFSPSLPARITSILTSSTSLTLNQVQFLGTGVTQSSPVPFSLLTVRAGTFNSQNVTISSLWFKNSIIPVVFSRECTKLNCTEWSVTSINLTQSFFSYSSDSSSSQNLRTNPESFTLVLQSSNFTSISSNSTSSASLLDSWSSSFPTDRTSIDNCSISSCSAASNTKGGASLLFLSKDGSLSISNSAMDWCNCSTDSGRGGFLYLNCTDPTADASFSGSNLPLTLSNITFANNKAYIANDIYITCVRVRKNALEDMFQPLTYETNPFDSLVALDSNGTEVPLLDGFFTSSTIFVSSAVSPTSTGNECGKAAVPCATLTTAVTHLSHEVCAPTLSITTSVTLSSPLTLTGASLTSTQPNPPPASPLSATVFVSHTITPASSSIITTSLYGTPGGVDACQPSITSLIFKFPSSLAGNAETFVFVTSNTVLTITSSRFEPEDASASLSCELVTVSASAGLVLTDVNISSLTSTLSFIHTFADSDLTVTNSHLTSLSSEKTTGKYLQIAGNARISGTTFNGLLTSSTFLSNHGNDGQCEWDGSLVSVDHAHMDISTSTFANATEGALSLHNSAEITISEWDFADNDPRLVGMPSFRRNALCSGSTLNVSSLKSGVVDENTNLWILTQDCTLKDKALVPKSALFVPTISSVSGILSDDENSIIITVSGSLLLPCSVQSTLKLNDSTTITDAHLDFNNENSLTITLDEAQITEQSGKAIEALSLSFGSYAGTIEHTLTRIEFPMIQIETETDTNTESIFEPPTSPETEFLTESETEPPSATESDPSPDSPSDNPTTEESDTNPDSPIESPTTEESDPTPDSPSENPATEASDTNPDSPSENPTTQESESLTESPTEPPSTTESDTNPDSTSESQMTPESEFLTESTTQMDTVTNTSTDEEEIEADEDDPHLTQSSQPSLLGLSLPLFVAILGLLGLLLILFACCLICVLCKKKKQEKDLPQNISLGTNVEKMKTDDEWEEYEWYSEDDDGGDEANLFEGRTTPTAQRRMIKLETETESLPGLTRESSRDALLPNRNMSQEYSDEDFAYMYDEKEQEKMYKLGGQKIFITRAQVDKKTGKQQLVTFEDEQGSYEEEEEEEEL